MYTCTAVHRPYSRLVNARGFLYGVTAAFPSKMPMENEEDVRLFQTIGLSEQKAKETLKNANVTKNLKLAISEVSVNSLANLVGSDIKCPLFSKLIKILN